MRDETQRYDTTTRQYRNMFSGCQTCGSIEDIDMKPIKTGWREYIQEILISLRLGKL